jgi:transcriptional regulator with XRE-family HTH domain
VLENVGPNLRRIRRNRDLTQQQVARFAGIRQQELSAFERGLRPKSATLDRLARALGVDINELLRPVTPKNESPDSAGNAGTGLIRRASDEHAEYSAPGA